MYVLREGQNRQSCRIQEEKQNTRNTSGSGKVSVNEARMSDKESSQSMSEDCEQTAWNRQAERAKDQDAERQAASRERNTNRGSP